MLCPNCSGEVKVLDTISTPDVNHRHRKCKNCGFVFYSQERVVDSCESDYLFREWSKERKRRHNAKKKGMMYEPKFQDGREVKPEPKLPTKPLF